MCRQVADHDVGLNESGAAVEDDTQVWCIFIKLVQQKNPGRGAALDPGRNHIQVICTGLFEALKVDERP